MHNAANNMLRPNCFGNDAIWVNSGHRVVCKVAAKTLQKPPRHAIHGCEHSGVRANQRRDVARHIRQRRRFDADDDEVLHAQVTRCSAARNSLRRERARLHQLQPVGLQRGQCRAARYHAHAGTRSRQAVAQPAAYSSGPINANFQNALSGPKKAVFQYKKWFLTNKYGREQLLIK